MKRMIAAAVGLFLVGIQAAAYAGEAADPESVRHQQILMQSIELSAEEAAALEEQLNSKPDDIEARLKLIAFYRGRPGKSPVDWKTWLDRYRDKRAAQIFWFIENRPHLDVSGGPLLGLHPFMDGDTYGTGKDLWLEQTRKHAESAKVHGNAASYLLLNDRKLAEDLLKKAKELEPDNPEWPSQLGHLYALDNRGGGIRGDAEGARQESARKSMVELEGAAADGDRRFSTLPDLAGMAFEAGELEKAQGYASELLEMARGEAGHWNHGNAVYFGHLVLGRIALSEGDIELAKHHLLESARHKGSPQLNSFGPKMTLAKELLGKGEKEAVIEFFDLCGKFWESGREQLEDWKVLVENDRMPDFRFHE